jgi:serine/threonine protein kinase
MSNQATKKKNLPVLEDIHGAKYPLKMQLASGGQGVVYTTDLPQTLIKGFTNKDESVKKCWREHIKWLIRQDLQDLKLARPLVLMKEPRMAYAMELMDGLIPLKDLFDSFIKATDSISEENRAPHIQDYLDQGGLKRRIGILCQLARTLNQLHSRGMLYGDISPDNIFVSDDINHTETWLIDCDNISFESHPGLAVYTPEYGAPELVRGEAMLSSLTDCWSFAVVAYQLLTHNHPLKGNLVNDGEPEIENEAFRGEHPWINDPDNLDNENFSNLPIQLIENSNLPALFQQTFGLGMHSPIERPTLAQWLEALTEVDEHLFTCSECGGYSLLPMEEFYLDEILCFFCDENMANDLVIFEEFIQLSEQEKNEKYPDLKEKKMATGRRVCIQPGDKKELKRLMPTFSYDKIPSDHIQLEYDDEKLVITPVEPLHISRGDNNIQEFKKKVPLKNSRKGNDPEPYCIHLGNPNETHVIWLFRW